MRKMSDIMRRVYYSYCLFLNLITVAMILDVKNDKLYEKGYWRYCLK